MRHIIVTIFILLQSALAGAAITSGFEFLRTDFNPRTSAMSGSFLTINGDLNALFVNPAGMADIQKQNYSFNYTNYLLDINGGSAAYNHIFPNIGVLSAGVLYMDYGNFTETNEFALPTGNTFSAHDFALVVGFANHLDEHFSYGVNAKYIYSQIENYSASAVALDFGLLYKAHFEQDLLFAVTLTNLGSNFAYYKDTKESLPKSLSIGASKKLAHLPLEIALTFSELNREGEDFSAYFKRFSLGGEFKVSKMFCLRIGYDYDLYEGLKNTTDKKFGGISAGAGILWNTYRFDYAYSNLSVLGNIHRFGFSGALP